MPSNYDRSSARETNRPDGQSRTTTAPTISRDKSPSEVADIYDEVADSLSRWTWVDRLFTGRLRRRQFGDVRGRVLEVACGTGTNLPYLPPSADYVGIDSSEEMVANARAELDRLALDGTVSRMDAQALTFPDDSFDAVISSFSTCTFPAPIEALREMARVCKPSGRIRLLEHGRSDVDTVSRFLDWRVDAHYEKQGCRWNQEPTELVREAGLSVAETRRAVLGIVTSIEAHPPAREK
jgi:ubiquinone/menaquinone biosynthesis C-methylase UbiE